jgi:hypothetical protein
MTAALLFVAAILGGGIAALSGFGIGSVLTPLLALSVGTKPAVIAVSIPTSGCDRDSFLEPAAQS